MSDDAREHLGQLRLGPARRGALLRDNPFATVLQADLRRPDEILEPRDLHDLLDLSRPVGVLMIAVLHFVSHEERPEVLIRRLRDAVVSGSYLAISHGTGEDERRRSPGSRRSTSRRRRR